MKEKNQKLKTLISDAQKKIISELSNQSTSNASKLKKFTHISSGRPPLEDTYPDLHQAIVALATAGAGADFRRRTDVLNACKSLDELHGGRLSSTAYSHGRDFDYALELEEFQSVVKNEGEILLKKTHVFPKPLMWLFIHLILL